MLREVLDGFLVGVNSIQSNEGRYSTRRIRVLLGSSSLAVALCSEWNTTDTITLRTQVKSGKTPLNLVIFRKKYSSTYFFKLPFDCNDIRRVGHDDDDDDDRLYVTLFVGVIRILLPREIRAETEETVEN